MCLIYTHKQTKKLIAIYDQLITSTKFPIKYKVEKKRNKDILWLTLIWQEWKHLLLKSFMDSCDENGGTCSLSKSYTILIHSYLNTTQPWTSCCLSSTQAGYTWNMTTFPINNSWNSYPQLFWKQTRITKERNV